MLTTKLSYIPAKIWLLSAKKTKVISSIKLDKMAIFKKILGFLLPEESMPMVPINTVLKYKYTCDFSL